MMPGAARQPTDVVACARYGGTVSDRRTIPLSVTLDGCGVDSETVCEWLGAYVLVIATTLPDPGLAVEVYSTFIGHPEVPTRAVHLMLGPVGRPPFTIDAEHKHEHLNPKTRPRQCAYEHAEILLQLLNGLDYETGIDVPEHAFDGLEHAKGQA
jgi:hypothetical protein